MNTNNFWKNKRVIITGGAGFIGSHLAKNLLNVCAKVLVLDNFERGRNFPEVEIHGKDLTDKQTCLDSIKDADVVVHLASKVGGIGFYQNNPYTVFRANTAMDTNVLQAVLENDVEYYFYASSAHVYPEHLQQDINSPAIVEEKITPASPGLSYGWAKLIGEKQLEYAQKEYPDLKVAIARYIGIYGPGQDCTLNTGSVIPVFCYRAIKHPEIPFTVWGTGKETRSYCFIDDAISATKRMIEKLQLQSFVGPYNIGSEQRISIENIANIVVQKSGKDIEIEYDTSKVTTIWGQLCDCSQAKKGINWETKTSLIHGIEKVYEDIERRIN